MKENGLPCTQDSFENMENTQREALYLSYCRMSPLPGDTIRLFGLKQRAKYFCMALCTLIVIITGGLVTDVYGQQGDLSCSMSMAPMVNDAPANVPAAFGATVDFGNATFGVTSSGVTNPGQAVNNNLASFGLCNSGCYDSVTPLCGLLMLPILIVPVTLQVLL